MSLEKNANGFHGFKITAKTFLFKAVWDIACEIRGSGVTGWDFKSYILNTLFYRYISEKLCKRINEDEHKAGYKDFDYAKISDDEIDAKIREDVISEIGYFLYPSELFCNVVKSMLLTPYILHMEDSLTKVVKSEKILPIPKMKGKI